MLRSLEKRLILKEYQFFHIIDSENENFVSYGFDEKSICTIKGLNKRENLLTRITRSRSRKDAVTFCSKNNVDLILSYTLSTLLVAERLSKRTSVPYAVWLHNDYKDSTKRYKKYGLDNCSNIIAVSNFIMNGVKEYFGEAKKNLFVVHNAIDTEKFISQADEFELPIEITPSKGNSLVIGMIAAMDRNKNPQLLLRACACIIKALPERNINVLLAGRFPDKGYETETILLAEELGIRDNVKFLGFQSNASAICRYADILVYPSSREAFSLSSLEAMTWGKPVVASRAGGIPEVVEDGVSGILCEPGDLSQFELAIKCLVEDADLRSTMGNRGRERVEKIFSMNQMAVNVEGILKTIVN